MLTGVTQAKVVIGAARLVRNALPNATYIGFTGTPISQKDRSTREVFGDYIDVYDMTQSVEDGATRPVFYESRVINLKLDEQSLRRIDAEYDAMAGRRRKSMSLRKASVNWGGSTRSLELTRRWHHCARTS